MQFSGEAFIRNTKNTPENTPKQFKISTKNVLFTQFHGATNRVLGAKGQEGHLFEEGLLLILFNYLNY